MSDETKCPFEVGQWVTDGVCVGRVYDNRPNWILVWDGTSANDVFHPDDLDWSRWVVFDPAGVKLWAQIVADILNDRDPGITKRLEQAEARVKELEALLNRIQNDWRWMGIDETEMSNAIRDALKVTKANTWPGEVCKRCLRRNVIGFNVPDGVWARVVGKSGTVWCLACFDEVAERKGVKYPAPELFQVSWHDWATGTARKALEADDV